MVIFRVKNLLKNTKDAGNDGEDLGKVNKCLHAPVRLIGAKIVATPR
jgi:hypothetical protein